MSVIKSQLFQRGMLWLQHSTVVHKEKKKQTKKNTKTLVIYR